MVMFKIMSQIYWQKMYFITLLRKLCRSNAGGEESKDFSGSFINRIISVLTFIVGDST